VLGRAVTWDEAAAALARGFSEALDLTLDPGRLSPREQALAAELRLGKYATDAWNQRA
jgi:lipoate-protein ligase A